MSYILSIDQGTSSTRSIIFDLNGNVVALSQREHTQYYPEPGFVEHDVEEIWMCTVRTIEEVMKKVHLTKKDILTIGITNQRETTVLWDRITGQCYHRAIVWNDTRTQSICDRYQDSALYIKSATGLPISPYFSATKMVYLLDSISPHNDLSNAVFGTIDTYLLWRLTGGLSYLTDTSNASRTLLLNLKTLEYDDKLLKIFGIPRRMLPRVCPSGSHFGVVNSSVATLGDLVGGVPITGILGDQQAALFGQSITRAGGVKVTYDSGLLTTVAYSIQDTTTKKITTAYALEGSVAYGGSVIQWLRDNLKIVSSPKECEQLANSVTSSAGVYFIPAFAGLYAPYWQPSARGLIGGLTAYHTRAHICRAAIEAAAYQVYDVVAAIQRDMTSLNIGHSASMLRVDGGMSVNELLLQFQSDILCLPLSRLRIAESTALGAAMVAGIGRGILTMDKVQDMYSSDGTWKPQMNDVQRQDKIAKWKFAVEKSIGWEASSSTSSIFTPTSSNIAPMRSIVAALTMFAAAVVLRARL